MKNSLIIHLTESSKCAYMRQSLLEIEDYSIMYINCIATFDMLHC